MRPLRSLEITRDGGFSRSWFDNVTMPCVQFGRSRAMGKEVMERRTELRSVEAKF